MTVQAVILCGGKGTRLGTLTINSPKPMVVVDGEPFLTTVIRNIARFGVTEVLLLAGYLGEQVSQRYDNLRIGNTVCKVLVEPHALGTGGALNYFKDFLDDEFFLLNGDTFFDINLIKFLRTSRASEKTITMALSCSADGDRYGTVVCENGLVRLFAEKSTEVKSNLINAGIYFIKKKVFDYYPKYSGGREISLEREILPELLKEGEIAAYSSECNRYFIDIGVPESLKNARSNFRKSLMRRAVFFDRDNTLNIDRGYTHKSTDLMWMAGAKEAISAFNSAGFYVFVVSNQSGVGRGFYTYEDAIDFHVKMNAELGEIGANIDDFVMCPHIPNKQGDPTCLCRKPNIGMLDLLIQRWSIQLSGSLMVGDSDTDKEFANSAGLSFVRADGDNLNEKLSDRYANANY